MIRRLLLKLIVILTVSWLLGALSALTVGVGCLLRSQLIAPAPAARQARTPPRGALPPAELLRIRATGWEPLALAHYRRDGAVDLPSPNYEVWIWEDFASMSTFPFQGETAHWRFFEDVYLNEVTPLARPALAGLRASAGWPERCILVERFVQNDPRAEHATCDRVKLCAFFKVLCTSHRQFTGGPKRRQTPPTSVPYEIRQEFLPTGVLWLPLLRNATRFGAAWAGLLLLPWLPRALWRLRFAIRHHQGRCRCGYDLQGSRSGVCPECGRAVT